MRMFALSSLFLLLAVPAIAQEQPASACHVETVNISDNVVMMSGISENCDQSRILSSHESGALLIGSAGTINVDNRTRRTPAAPLAICRTDATLRIVVGDQLQIYGGRPCGPRETPSVVIDPTTGNVVGGVNSGNLIIEVQ